MVRDWLRDSGAVVAVVGLMLLVAPFTFGVGGILVAAGIALLATWGLFTVVVYAYDGAVRATRALGRAHHLRPRVHHRRHA